MSFGVGFSHECCISAELCRLLRCACSSSSNGYSSTGDCSEQWPVQCPGKWSSHDEQPSSQCIQRSTGAFRSAATFEASLKSQACQWRRPRWRWSEQPHGPPPSRPLLCSRISPALGEFCVEFCQRPVECRTSRTEERRGPLLWRSPTAATTTTRRQQFLHLQRHWTRRRRRSGDQSSRNQQQQHQFVVVRWTANEQCP